jgi:RNAse (barnase) inhibitor barstar
MLTYLFYVKKQWLIKNKPLRHLFLGVKKGTLLPIMTTNISENNLYGQPALANLSSSVANKQVLGPKTAPTWRTALAAREAGPTAALRAVRTNIVQSIRAFRTADLMEAAEELGNHFIYANATEAITKSEVLDRIAKGFYFPRQQAKNFDNLLDSLTTLIDRSGPQPGFVIVLEGLPCTHKFDKEARETLLDVFRDAVEFWADRRVSCRVFYSFA